MRAGSFLEVRNHRLEAHRVGVLRLLPGPNVPTPRNPSGFVNALNVLYSTGIASQVY